MMSASQRWGPPCKPVLPLPGTEGLLCYLEKGSFEMMQPRCPEKKAEVLLDLLPCSFRLARHAVQRSSVLKRQYATERSVSLVFFSPCLGTYYGSLSTSIGTAGPELDQQTLKTGQGCNEFMRLPDHHHHQQASLFLYELVYLASPTTIGRGEKKPTARRLTFSICGIHH